MSISMRRGLDFSSPSFLPRDYGVDADTLAEMSKDVNRLSTIASRFSKIGSEPRMELVELRTVVAEAVDYMGTRISPRKWCLVPP